MDQEKDDAKKVEEPDVIDVSAPKSGTTEEQPLKASKDESKKQEKPISNITEGKKKVLAQLMQDDNAEDNDDNLEAQELGDDISERLETDTDELPNDEIVE